MAGMPRRRERKRKERCTRAARESGAVSRIIRNDPNNPDTETEVINRSKVAAPKFVPREVYDVVPPDGKKLSPTGAKRMIRDALQAIMETPQPLFGGETAAMALAQAMVHKALVEGDVNAFCAIRDTIGERPTNRSEVVQKEAVRMVLLDDEGAELADARTVESKPVKALPTKRKRKVKPDAGEGEA